MSRRTRLTKRVNEILKVQAKAGYMEEFQRRMEALTPREKEITRRALTEPYDESIAEEFQQILVKMSAWH
jgi:FixJ family two-component response regulator